MDVVVQGVKSPLGTPHPLLESRSLSPSYSGFSANVQLVQWLGLYLHMGDPA